MSLWANPADRILTTPVKSEVHLSGINRKAGQNVRLYLSQHLSDR